MPQLYEDYRDIAEFRRVYIREAHAADSDWAVGYAKDLNLLEHKNYGQRCTAAEKLFKDEKLSMPCLIDGIDNKVNEAYKAHPDRVFLVRKDGTLGVAGKRGPFGFKPALDQTKAWLAEYRRAGDEPALAFAQEKEEEPEPPRRKRKGLSLWSTGDDDKQADRKSPERSPRGEGFGRRARSERPASKLSAVVGDWEMKTEFGGQIIEATMTLSVKDDALVGMWVSMGRDMELSNVEFDGQTLSFNRELGPGQRLSFEGSVQGNKITGKYSGPFGEINSNGARAALAEAETEPEAEAPVPMGTSLLDGREKSFVVVGYSTSFAWPEMLQEMLNEHADGRHIYHVLNAVVGGSPVEPWIAEPGSEAYEKTVGAMLRDYFGPNARLRRGAAEPTVALCQQSLQLTRSRLGPIASAADVEGIRIGADALEKLATRLHEHGVDAVYVAMHIYKKGYEPQVGNERFALQELLSRGHDFVFAGPDVWSLTVGQHPGAFTEDGLHPNERGMKIMAEGWYRTMAGADARQEVIDRLHARSYDVEKMMDDYMASRREAAKPSRKTAERVEEPARPELTAPQRAQKIQDLTRDLITVSGKGERGKALEIALEALRHADILREQGWERAGSFVSLTNYNAACMYSLMRQKDKAFKHLDVAVAAGGFGGDLPNQMENDADFDNIRGDPRFKEALRKARGPLGAVGQSGSAEEPEFRGVLGADSDKFKKVGGKTLLWASGEVESADAKWYDFSGAPMPAEELQFGIGQDRIKSIDDPLFVEPDDPRLLEIPASSYRPEEKADTNDDIMVIGYEINGDARAYPAALLDEHELVNDLIGGKPVTVGW